jgi:hypothetical protein
MAKKDDDKNAAAPADVASASMNKAQAEYQHYLKRVQGQNPGGMQGYIAMPAGEGVPGWAVPPSVAMLAHGPGGYYAAMPQGGPHGGQGSLTHSLGSTIRLGVDVVNAALAGGVRLLNGISGAAYGHGEQGHGHHDCGCGCNSGCDCCGDDCCGSDCCGCECCQPGVGSCC